MKILITARDDISVSKRIGVKKKLTSIVSTFLDYGNTVCLIYPAKKNIICESWIKTQKNVSIQTNKKDLINRLLPMNLGIYQFLLNYIKKERPDILYIRYPLSEPIFIHFLKITKKIVPEIKIFIDVPTYPYIYEYKSKSTIKYLLSYIDLYFQKQLKNYIDYVVSYYNHKTIFDIPVIFIQNAVDLTNLPIKKNPESAANQLDILFVGNLAPWHGLDRFIEGLANYKKNNGPYEIILHIIGTGTEMKKLKKISIRSEVSQSVIFYGGKTGNELDEIFNKCHLGIEMLKPQIRGYSENNSIKAREYCGRGFPFIASGNDIDFKADFPYILRLPATSEPIDINAVIKFYNKIKNDNYADYMRKFAEEKLTWKIKLKNLNKILNT